MQPPQSAPPGHDRPWDVQWLTTVASRLVLPLRVSLSPGSLQVLSGPTESLVVPVPSNLGMELLVQANQLHDRGQKGLAIHFFLGSRWYR